MGNCLHPHGGYSKNRQAYYGQQVPTELSAIDRTEPQKPSYAPAPKPVRISYYDLEKTCVERGLRYCRELNRYMKNDAKSLMTYFMTPQKADADRQCSLEMKAKLSGLLKGLLMTDAIIVYMAEGDASHWTKFILEHIKREELPKPEKKEFATQEDLKAYKISEFLAQFATQDFCVIRLREALDEIKAKGPIGGDITISFDDIKAVLKQRITLLRDALN